MNKVRGEVQNALFKNAKSEAKKEFLREKDRKTSRLFESEVIGWYQGLKGIDLQLAEKVHERKVVVDSMVANKFNYLHYRVQKNELKESQFHIWARYTFTKILAKMDQYETLERDEFVQTYHGDLNEASEFYFIGRPEEKSEIACKSGCSNCCHQYIPATPPEVEYLLEKNNVSFSDEQRETLFEQSLHHIQDHLVHSSHSQQRCQFLDENDACSIYENRPGMCRSFYAKYTDQFCNFFDPESENIKSFSPDEASICMSAALSLFGEFSLSELSYFYS